jgi:hypothetical protein
MAKRVASINDSLPPHRHDERINELFAELGRLIKIRGYELSSMKQKASKRDRRVKRNKAGPVSSGAVLLEPPQRVSAEYFGVYIGPKRV